MSLTSKINDSFLMQREIDWAVGQVFKALKSSNVYYNTFVFLTADNGYESLSVTLSISPSPSSSVCIALRGS